MEERKRLKNFHPKVTVIGNDISELSSFNAGNDDVTFNEYLINDALSDLAQGKGVTHLIWNHIGDGQNELVAYFTLSVGVIPYYDGIDENESVNTISNYPYITTAELKMFAVDQSYQDLFFVHEDEDLPIAAWCLRHIVNHVTDIAANYISIQAIALHSVKEAEGFYITNGFHYADSIMRSLYTSDDELKLMWMKLAPLEEYTRIYARTEKDDN